VQPQKNHFKDTFHLGNVIFKISQRDSSLGVVLGEKSNNVFYDSIRQNAKIQKTDVIHFSSLTGFHYDSIESVFQPDLNLMRAYDDALYDTIQKAYKKRESIKSSILKSFNIMDSSTIKNWIRQYIGVKYNGKEYLVNTFHFNNIYPDNFYDLLLAKDSSILNLISKNENQSIEKSLFTGFFYQRFCSDILASFITVYSVEERRITLLLQFPDENPKKVKLIR